MNVLEALIASDPSIADEFKRVFQVPQLHREARKAAPRRFTEQPEPVSAFGTLYQMTPERRQEIQAEELAAERDQARFEAIWGDDDGSDDE